MTKALDRKAREKLGRRAEFLAANYLRLKGYRILEQRFKTKAGEIDLIARRKDLLVIVEVKARQEINAARESISAQSRQRIERAAHSYIAYNTQVQHLGIRYDAVFVIGGWRVRHEPDFWRSS